MLARVGELAEKHPYPEVRASMSSLLPVLAGIQQDVEKQLAQPPKAKPAAPALNLSAPPATSAQ